MIDWTFIASPPLRRYKLWGCASAAGATPGMDLFPSATSFSIIREIYGWGCWMGKINSSLFAICVKKSTPLLDFR